MWRKAIITAVWSLALLWAVSGWDPPVAMARVGDHQQSPSHPPRPLLVNRESEVANILSVLERKVGDHPLPRKAKDKLLTLSDEKLRLVASLCERISVGSDTPGAEVAFLLIAALIIWS